MGNDKVRGTDQADLSFGGLVKISGTDSAASDALGAFKRSGSSFTFSFDASVKIPLIHTEGKALIKADNGKFDMRLQTSLFGAFKGDMSVKLSYSLLELEYTYSVDVAKVVKNIADAARKAIGAVFDGILKITEYIDKVEAAAKWGIDKLCEMLKLDEVDIPGTDYNVCDALKEFADNIVDKVKDVLAPVMTLFVVLSIKL